MTLACCSGFLSKRGGLVPVFPEHPNHVPFGRSTRKLKPVACKHVDIETADEKIVRLTATVERLKSRIAELEETPSRVKSARKDRDRVRENENHPALPRQLFKSTIKDPPIRKPTKPDTGIIDGASNIVWPSPSDEVPFWKRGPFKKQQLSAGDDSAVAGSMTAGDIDYDRDPLYIVHVTAEMAPLAKVGGLGDVVTGLGRACIERGHKVQVMLPFYECIPTDSIDSYSLGDSFKSYHKGNWVSVQIHTGKVAGVPVVLVEPVNQFFKGSRIYGGCYEELEAYLFFSRACLEWMQTTNRHPDIIHVHEWHTGALSMLYWDMYHHLSLKKPRLVLTIHNMEHYGECRMEQLNMCGLDGSIYLTADRAVDDRTIGHNPERLSLLKGGIVYSNAVTTVSPTYVNETLCSGWLSSTLMKHRHKYFGILNGIDTELWNPAFDPHLPVGFDAKDLSGKLICKHYVQRGLGLEPDALPRRRQPSYDDEGKRSPLVVCITRLVPQKGIHLIRHAMYHLDHLDGQFVLLGTAPDPRVRNEFEQLASSFRESKKIRLLLTYSEELAHLLYAAADIVLVPSMFEPCGLTQMIGMRYGAVPVVRKTGGLADTVFDVDYQQNSDLANGFVFEGIDERSLDSALDRALKKFRERSSAWQSLMLKAMHVDHSWNKSAREYVSVYNSVRVR